MKKIKQILTMAALALVYITAVFPAGATGEQSRIWTSLAPSGLVMVEDTIYIADSYQRGIRALKDGGSSILTGASKVNDLSGRPVGGYNDGAFSQALFEEPWAIVAYRDGLLVSDTGNHVLRYLDLEQEKVYTAAGSGKAGNQDGNLTKASFASPTGLAVGEDGTVYIADTGNHVIRAMDQDGNVTTYAGSGQGCALGTLDEAQFSQPTGLCWADGVLYVADTGNHRIVAIRNGQVTLVAGAQQNGDALYEGAYLDGSAEAACFASPQGLAVGYDGTIYVADTGNGAVRTIRDGTFDTLIAANGDTVYPISPRGLLVDHGTLYVGDIFSRVLLRLNTQG